MNNTKKKADPIPEEFNSYEEAAEFWDTHDTTDYPDQFEVIAVEAKFKGRRYEVEIDEDVIKLLRQRAQKLGVSVSYLTNDMLRRQIMPGR
jgi:hypothetical protein